MSDAIEQLGRALEAALAASLGPCQVVGLQRMTGGASRETWSFDARDADGTLHELVLRRDPGGRPSPPGAVSAEAHSMRLAAGEGVEVPAVLIDAEEPAHWGGAGMIMTRVGGEALARRILRDDRFGQARKVLVGQAARALAQLHRVDPDELASRAPVVGDGGDALGALRDVYDELAIPVQVFEHAFNWLAQHRPPSGARAVVHGDFRLGNLLIDETGLAAVLDWELVHLGDPVEDLGWFCVKAWRFGNEAAVAGVGQRTELLEAYEAAGGQRVDPASLNWWEVFGTLRWGVICLTQTSVHLRWEMRSVELAAIGRRVPEVEWDLLALLEPAPAARALDAATRRSDAAAPHSTTARDGLHGPPDAAELVDAVREFLTDDIMTSEDPVLSFRARVAANVLAMVAREFRDDGVGGVRRAVPPDGPGDRSAFVEELAAEVVERLLVANPRYLGRGVEDLLGTGRH